VKGVRRIGVRLGNWLTPEQGRRLLESATPLTARELRDHAMVAMLIGCGLRRAELLALSLESIQRREEHWVIADLVGKGGHVRTVPIPNWVKSTLDAWMAAAAITHGRVFRAINKAGSCMGRRHVTQGAVGCCPRRSGSCGDRQARSARPAAHLRPSLPSRRR
jgi:site-specific recombinase XerD